MDRTDPRLPAPGAHSYDVNVPLWSDGAQKNRFFVLPEGETIRISSDDGDWLIPRGTVLGKNFWIDGEIIETRLLVHGRDGSWRGYSYEWNGGDARLLSGEKQREVNGRTWTFPSRTQCFSCHTGAANVSLGLETVQLNRGGQLQGLAAAGVFETPPNVNEASRLYGADENAPLALRARSALHVNCASCHRPGGPTAGLDLRFETPLSQTGACDRPPAHGDLGARDAKILAPGAPERSVLSLRMDDLSTARMPPLGSAVLDAPSIGIINSWIARTSSCRD